MIYRSQWGTFAALIATGYIILNFFGIEAGANTNNSAIVKSKPSGVLANAANAANAAANAAIAAANAANAAAKAAAAALDAINSIQPQSEAEIPQSAQSTSPSVDLPQTADLVVNSSSDQSNGSTKFLTPSEQSLVGLIGRYEIPVMTGSVTELSKTLAAYQAVGDGPIGESSETNLAESITAGRSFSRDTLVAGARADQAKAQTGQAFALLLPSVSIRANRGLENSAPSVAVDPNTGKVISSETHTRTDAALVVSQPLFDLPSYFDWRRREVIERSRNESHRASDGDAYLSTVNAYLSLVSSRLLADMTRDFEMQLKELLVYIEKRANAGAASVSDMARVRARSQSAVSSRMEQESAHVAAAIEFVRLTNRMPKMVRLPELADVGASMMPDALDVAVTLSMVQNPEIASLLAEMQAGGIDKSLANSRFLPKVSLEYTDNYSLHAGGNTSAAGQRDKRLMVVANWSLFSGGSDYNYKNERIAREMELKYRLDDQRRRTAQTLSTNYGTISTTRQRLAVGYKELKSMSTAAEAMSKRMLSGNQSLLDLLDVYDRYYQARVRLVNLHILEMNTIAQTVRLVKGVPVADAATPAKVGNPVLPLDTTKPGAIEKPVPSAAATGDKEQMPKMERLNGLGSK